MIDAQFKILIRVLYYGFTCLLLKACPNTGSHLALKNAAKEAGSVYI